MLNPFPIPSQPYLRRILPQSLLVGAITAFSLLSGLTPDLLGRSPTLIFSSSAYAQAIDDPELTNYVLASLEIERLRREVYEKIKGRNQGNVPQISCNALDTLPSNIIELGRNFCEESERIVQKYGFSNSRYNVIMRNQASDADLSGRIRKKVEQILGTGG
ncbi:DUF4168 domain-containing protein [Lyngbya aestuarii]|uniref:DUF4168 domain-containing protein n=1 Tax=Lyngbya aestuarii TaxID=118322 RepID=UPI00403D625D